MRTRRKWDRVDRLHDAVQCALECLFAQDQVAGLVIAMAQQGQHRVVGLPARQVAGRSNLVGHAPGKRAPQEALRTLVIEEPRQPREYAGCEPTVQQCGTRHLWDEQVAIAVQRMQLPQRFGLALIGDAEQRPAATGASNLTSQGVARGPRLADAHDYIARRGQQS